MTTSGLRSHCSIPQTHATLLLLSRRPKSETRWSRAGDRFRDSREKFVFRSILFLAVTQNGDRMFRPVPFEPINAAFRPGDEVPIPTAPTNLPAEFLWFSRQGALLHRAVPSPEQPRRHAPHREPSRGKLRQPRRIGARPRSQRHPRGLMQGEIPSGLGVQSRRVVIQAITIFFGRHYGPSTTRECPHDRGGPSSATAE